MSDLIGLCAQDTATPEQQHIRHLKHEVEMLTNAGVIECMVRNKGVAEYVSNLEARIAELEAQLKLLREIESQHALLQKLTHAEKGYDYGGECGGCASMVQTKPGRRLDATFRCSTAFRLPHPPCHHIERNRMKVDWDELKRLHQAGIANPYGRWAIFMDACANAFPAILAEREAAQAQDSFEGDTISDQIKGMLESGTRCPLCARTGMHTHSPEEIIIYRNGVKYGKRLVADLQSALEFEQKGTDAIMKVLNMEPTEGGNFNRLKACGIIRGMKAKLEAAQRLRDAMAQLLEDGVHPTWSGIKNAETALAAFDKETQNEG